jgi:hypothetical protein
MPSNRKKRTPPIIVDGKRYKYVESNGGLCQNCAGLKDVKLCLNLPSCFGGLGGGYFVEVNEEKQSAMRETARKDTDR